MIFLHSTKLASVAWFSSGTDDDHSRKARSGDKERTSLRPLRVLIVEDEFFISLAAEAMLEALGHSVVGIAVSADEAEQLADQERPDVILMDIRLIGTRDGIEAATAIHNRLQIPSIFVTANTDPGTRLRASGAHPLGFIEKPLTEGRLKQHLASL